MRLWMSFGRIAGYCSDKFHQSRLKKSGIKIRLRVLRYTFESVDSLWLIYQVQSINQLFAICLFLKIFFKSFGIFPVHFTLPKQFRLTEITVFRYNFINSWKFLSFHIFSHCVFFNVGNTLIFHKMLQDNPVYLWHFCRGQPHLPALRFYFYNRCMEGSNEISVKELRSDAVEWLSKLH